MHGALHAEAHRSGAPSPLPPRGAFAAACWGIGVSLLALLLACALAYTLRAQVGSVGSGCSVAVTFAVLTSLGLLALATRKRLPGRDGAVASIATLGWLPILFSALAAFRDPIVSGECASGECGMGAAIALFVTALATGPVLLLSAVVARSLRSPRLDRPLRGVTLVVLIAVGMSSGVGLLRIRRPDADSYIATVPIVSELHQDESLALADGTKITYAMQSRPDRPPSSMDVPGCVLEGIDMAHHVEPACGPLDVGHDARADLWIVAPHDARDAHGDMPRRWFAFKGTEKRVREIDSRDVSDEIAPPRWWTLGAVIGVLLGVTFAIVGVRLDRRGKSLRDVEGILGDGGWATLQGSGAPVLLRGAEKVAPGPVLVRVAGAQGGPVASYRDAGTPAVESWQPGTLEEARAALTARAATFYALATTSALLCAAPLILSGFGGSR